MKVYRNVGKSNQNLSQKQAPRPNQNWTELEFWIFAINVSSVTHLLCWKIVNVLLVPMGTCERMSIIWQTSTNYCLKFCYLFTTYIKCWNYQWTFIRCWKWTWRWVLRLHKKAIINITLQTKLDKILLWRLHKIIFYFTIAFSQISELPCYSLFDQCILRRRKSRGSIVKPEGTVYYLLFLTPIPRLNIY